MDGYCKLHAKIITSSIWNAPDHVRLLWITMLATADAGGHVEGSVGGLAHMARISVAQAKDALEALAGPDPDSGDETSGERIRKVAPGVWHILNHSHYRERQTRRQALQASASKRYRENKQGDDDESSSSSSPVYVSESPSESPSVPSEKKAPKVTPDDGFDGFWEAYPRKTKKGDAKKAWKKVKAAMREQVIEAVEEFASMVTKPEFIPYPSTWLNGCCWDDHHADSAACAKDTKPKTAFQQCDEGHDLNSELNKWKDEPVVQ